MNVIVSLGGDEVELRYADDGVGLPEGFDPRAMGGMGLQTIYALGERQLGGKIEFGPGPGFSCRLAFVNAQVKSCI